MRKTIKILAFVSISLLVSTSLIAQCTDNDGDGYYYEEGCGTDPDCNDADPDIYPGATEICNGYDDDCDGDIDEGCDTSCDTPDKYGSDRRLTYDSSSSQVSCLVWTGTEYGIVWLEYRDGNDEIYFARADSSGNKIGLDIRLTYDPAVSRWPSLTWTGSEYGVSWNDDRVGHVEIYFTRLDSEGNKIGSDVRVTNSSTDSEYSSLVWAGNNYGISWEDWGSIYFARLDSEGNKIGSDIPVTYGSRSSLVWTGSNFGISWQERRDLLGPDIYFVRLDSLGNKIGSDAQITNTLKGCYESSLVWTGSEYGVSWHDFRNNAIDAEIYFARIHSLGYKIGSEVRVTNDPNESNLPSLTWTGNEYGISWMDDRDGPSTNSPEEIYFARLDSSGIKIGSDIRITYDSTYSAYPSLNWSGSEHGIAWNDDRDGNREIYFAQVKCCDNDVDMDSYGACEDCNDKDDTINPDATEICDYVDNNCDGTIDEGYPTPGGTTGLTFENNKQTMNWDVEAIADRYDVMKGDLITLRSSGGDFTSSISDCLENDSADTQSFDSDEPSSPGDGFYYVVRAQADCRNGTCNCGHASQVEDRDSEIDKSSNKCP